MRQAGDLCGELLQVYSKSGWIPACFQHAPLIHSLAGSEGQTIVHADQLSDKDYRG
jgi:hypothetical protein